jgi:hypothetical protein
MDISTTAMHAMPVIQMEVRIKITDSEHSLKFRGVSSEKKAPKFSQAKKN